MFRAGMARIKMPDIRGSSLRAELTRHAGGTFLLKIIGLFLSLVTGIMLARMLGAEGYGIYAFPMAVVGLLTIPSTVGLPQLLVRNIAQYNAKGEYGLIRGIIKRANGFVLILSLSFSALSVALYIGFDPEKLASPLGKTFVIAMGLLPIISLKHVRLAALRGLGKVLFGQIPDILIKPLLFVSFLSFLFLLPISASPQIIMCFQLISAFAVFLLGDLLLKRNLPEKVFSSEYVFDTKRWINSAVPFLFLGLMQIVNQRTDLVMLGILRPVSEVGVYRAVVHGSTFVTFVLSSVNTAQRPQIARLWAMGEKEKLQRMITASTRVISIATVFAAGVLFFWGRFFIVFLFGQEFASGLTALRILCLGQMVNGMAGSVGSILNMTGHEKKSAHAVCIAAIVNVVLNLLLIPRFGINGAAIATAVSLSTWNIILIFWVKKYTGLKSTVFRC